MPKISDVIEGLKILAKYEPKGLDSWSIDAQHDVIYAGPDCDEEAISPEDREELERLGWHYDESVNSWARFT